MSGLTPAEEHYWSAVTLAEAIRRATARTAALPEERVEEADHD